MENIFSHLLSNNQVWIITNDDDHYGIFSKYINHNAVGECYGIFSKENYYLLINELDQDNFESNSNIIPFKNQEDLFLKFHDILKNLKPSIVYLNYSNNVLIDELGHGKFLFLENILKTILDSVQICSAEKLLLNIYQYNTDEDINYFKLSAKRANDIIDKTFKQIKVGMTEKQIADLLLKNYHRKPKWFKNVGVVHETFAWGNPCPIVLVGENFVKGGHTAPTDYILKPGETIYFDFGVSLTFSNGKTYASDLQRMGYCLKQNETEKTIPENILKVFNTLYHAVSLGQKLASNKTKGYDVDSVVRNHILENGYPNYNHGTGHCVGEKAHNYGARLSTKNIEESNLNLVTNAIYTIEPRIMIPNGGSIEEMIVVKENKSEFISPRQKKLYVIKS